MNYDLGLELSVAALALSVLLALLVWRKVIHIGKLRAIHITYVGVFAAILFVLFPMLVKKTAGFEAFVFSVVTTIQTFGAGLKFEDLQTGLDQTSAVNRLYFNGLLLLAPILTVGAVLSFFKDTVASLHFWSRQRWKNVYIFSVLNDNTLVTAKSTRSAHGGALIVFCNTKYAQEDLLAEAETYADILLKQPVTDIILHKKWLAGLKNQLFLMEEHEEKNLEHALALAARYQGLGNTSIYVLAVSATSELLLDGAGSGGVYLRRIHRKRSMVYHHIYDNSIFAGAVQNQGEKMISYLIVGAGDTGIELMKALVWCGQMPGYRLEIHLVDQRSDITSKLWAQMPELMERNGIQEDGECSYQIHVHEGMDAEGSGLCELVDRQITPTHVLVALGRDGLNIDTAMKVRMLCECRHLKPEIYAVVYSDRLAKLMHKEGNGGGFDIRCIGNRSIQFRLENITASKLDTIGALVNRGYGGSDEDFRANEYGRRSSIATAIHTKFKKELGIDLFSEEAACLEHKRWNAYMRTEGYRFLQKRDTSPESRSEKSALAKQHSDLVPYQCLNRRAKESDRRIMRYLVDKDL